MDWATIVSLLAIGAILGVIGGLFGIGGGLFAIPVLGIFFGFDEQHAQGTSLVMVVPNVVVGLWNYARRGNFDRRLALSLAIAALPATIVAAHIATRLPSPPLRVAFAVFTLCIATFVGYRAVAPARVRSGAATRRPLGVWPTATGVGALGGVLSGLFGVGGALFAVPLLSVLYELSQATAQAYGLALIAPGTIAGIATYAASGDVDWVRGVPLALGGFVSVPLGVRIAYRLSERTLRGAFAALMVVSAAALLLYRR